LRIESFDSKMNVFVNSDLAKALARKTTEDSKILRSHIPTDLKYQKKWSKDSLKESDILIAGQISCNPTAFEWLKSMVVSNVIVAYSMNPIFPISMPIELNPRASKEHCEEYLIPLYYGHWFYFIQIGEEYYQLTLYNLSQAFHVSDKLLKRAFICHNAIHMGGDETNSVSIIPMIAPELYTHLLRHRWDGFELEVLEDYRVNPPQSELIQTAPWPAIRTKPLDVMEWIERSGEPFDEVWMRAVSSCLVVHDMLIGSHESSVNQ
jgi:hypothetical protein